MDRENHVCPVWVGYLLLSPFRRLFENPEKLLSPHVRPGMTVLDVGCAMGFFSLPLAKMVGETGKVICVDVQEKMIAKLEKRAGKAGLSERIELRVCESRSLCLNEKKGAIDFAAAFHVMHEAPDIPVLLGEIHDLLRPEGRLLIVEPAGHISKKDFEETVSAAEEAGFTVSAHPGVRRNHAVLVEKKS